ncbi:hypothetical protein HRbin11_02180 [bacterium HR11]|nr:hypothetical protein HRbin11_02180 [bacterium HR11]
MRWKRAVLWLGLVGGISGDLACRGEGGPTLPPAKAPEVYIYYPHPQAEMSQLASTDTVVHLESRVGRTGRIRTDCHRLVVEADGLVYNGPCEDQGIYFRDERERYSPLGEQGGTNGIGVSHRMYIRFRREGRFRVRVVAFHRSARTEVFSPEVEVNDRKLEEAAGSFVRDYWTRPMPPEEVHVVDDNSGQLDKILAAVDYLGKLGFPIRFLDNRRVRPYIIYHPPTEEMANRGGCFDPLAHECEVWLGRPSINGDWQLFRIAIHETLHVLGIYVHTHDRSVMDVSIPTVFSTLWIHPYIQKAARLKRRGF